MKRVSMLVLAFAVAAEAASAEPPASKDACLERAFTLAEKAAAKKFPAEKQTKIEGLLTSLETKCAADDLAGSEGDIKSIEVEIGGN
jgi:hypothetical protein